jgi:hypothetical protein
MRYSMTMFHSITASLRSRNACGWQFARLHAGSLLVMIVLNAVRTCDLLLLSR